MSRDIASVSRSLGRSRMMVSANNTWRSYMLLWKKKILLKT
jgi:hypothetical protein